MKYRFIFALVMLMTLFGCDFLGSNSSSTTTTYSPLDSTTVTTSLTVTENPLYEKLYHIYNLAVESSFFEGTYEEWLETVKGPQGDPGRDIVLRVENSYIQWKYEDETNWYNLIELDALIGPSGSDGTNGSDGREVSFRVDSNFIQWQYVGDDTWQNLIGLSNLVGPSGVDGLNGEDGKEVVLQVANGFVQWKYQGEQLWADLIELDSLVGENGKEVSFQVADGYIQWQYQGESSWANLVDLSSLIGQKGEDGENGREVVFQVDSSYIQWKYTDESVWNNLIEINSLIGPSGNNGVDGREVVFQVDDDYLKWQYVGDNAWYSLIQISSLIGPAGKDGKTTIFQVADGNIQWRYEGEDIWFNLISLESLRGQDGENGLSVIFQVSDEFLLWSYEGEENWHRLIDLSTLIGPSGLDGKNGNDGLTPIFQVANGYIQWQYQGDDGWKNLIELTTLIGPAGKDGKEVVFQVANSFIQWQYEGDDYWINLLDTNTLIGNPGSDGKSAYEIYIEYYPDYQGTEEEWLNDLINGELGKKDYYNVYFDSLGGTFISSQVVEKYTTCEKPIDPYKLGYQFLYWEYLEYEWIFFGYVVSQDLTLTAKYELVTYNINYNLNGGVNNSLNPDKYNIESNGVSFLEPVKEGYVFTGWTTSENDIPTKTVEILPGSYGDISLTANWYEVDTSTYSSENGNVNQDGVIGIYHYIEFFDNNVFMMVTSTLYNDLRFDHKAEYGEMLDLGNNVYLLDYVSSTEENEFITILENGIFFCDELGEILDENYGNDGWSALDGTNLDLLEFGYGYFDLSYQPNGVGMKNLYEDLYYHNMLIKNSIDDLTSKNIFTFNYLDYSITLDDALKTIKLFVLDHPEFYWIANSYSADGNTLTMNLVEEYLVYELRNQVDTAYANAVSELEAIIASNSSELEIVKAVHDYIIDNVDYAYETDGVTPSNEYWAHNIAGVLFGKGAVCAGYSELFDLLLNEFNIYSIPITGYVDEVKHQWNLVRIDDVFYFIDPTFNDLGNQGVIYNYFGMSYSALQDTHIIDSTNSFGFDYLYNLPLVSEISLTFVSLYENNQYVSLFISLDDAVDNMTNSESSYTVEFFKFFDGTSHFLSEDREYYLNTMIMPEVAAIYFKGPFNEYGWNTGSNVRLFVPSSLEINSPMFFENICLDSKSLSTINIKNHSITFDGFYDSTQNVNITGGTGSTIINATSYQIELWGNVNIDIFDSYNETLLRGNFNQINVGNIFGNYAYFYAIGPVIELSFNEININNCLWVIKLHPLNEDFVLNIGDINVTDNWSDTASRLLQVDVSEIEYFPTINITGEVDIYKLDYRFISEIVYTSVSTNGETFEFIQKSNLVDIGSQVVLTAPNLDMANFMFTYDGHDITALYTKDDLGNIYRDKSFVEVINGNTLVEVISLNESFVNEYYVPEGIEIISAGCFDGYINLTNVILSNTVVEIQRYAFNNVRTMNKIFIPSSVLVIDDNAFDYGFTIMTNLLELPDGWMMGKREFFTYIQGFQEIRDNEVFRYVVTSLDTIFLLSFSQGYNPVNLVIPDYIDGLPVVGFTSSAFSENITIQTVYVGMNVQFIPYHAFINNQFLNTINFDQNSSLKEIKRSAFFGLLFMDEIFIPSSVEVIGNYAFGGMPGLTIYAVPEEKPSAWASEWVGADTIIVWGYNPN